MYVNVIHTRTHTHTNTHLLYAQWTQWCPEVNDDWSWLTDASVCVVVTDGCGCIGGLKLLKSKQPPKLTSCLITSSTLHCGGKLSKLMLSSSYGKCDEPINCPTTVADMLSSCGSSNMLSNDIQSCKGGGKKLNKTRQVQQISNRTWMMRLRERLFRTGWTYGGGI